MANIYRPAWRVNNISVNGGKLSVKYLLFFFFLKQETYS